MSYGACEGVAVDIDERSLEPARRQPRHLLGRRRHAGERVRPALCRPLRYRLAIGADSSSQGPGGVVAKHGQRSQAKRKRRALATLQPTTLLGFVAVIAITVAANLMLRG